METAQDIRPTLSLALQVRPASLEDAAFISSLLNAEIARSTHNYESKPSTAEEKRHWLALLFSRRLPVLVVENSGTPVGFAALTPFNPNSGYQFTTTVLMYIAPGFQGLGIGKRLAQGLKKAAQERKIHSVVAGINSRNKASLALLESIGFKQVGYFKEIGFKNGEWQDDICLQLLL